jgi:hypothetical protein
LSPVGKALGILLALWSAVPALSRECGNDIPVLLDRIEEVKSGTDSAGLVQLLRCLSEPVVRWVSDADLFFSEDALDEIEAATDKDRLRVYKILIPLISSDDWLVSQEAAASLAYYGYAPAGQMLDGYPNGPMKAVLYAVVDYKESYRWAIDQLIKSDRLSQPEDEANDNAAVYLGLLYRLAEPLSLPYLNGLISSDVDPELQARAELVRERIFRLHPGLK